MIHYVVVGTDSKERTRERLIPALSMDQAIDIYDARFGRAYGAQSHSAAINRAIADLERAERRIRFLRDLVPESEDV